MIITRNAPLDGMVVQMLQLERKSGQFESRTERPILRPEMLILCLCPMLFAATRKSAITRDAKSGL